MGMEAILKIPIPQTKKQVEERISGGWGGIFSGFAKIA